MRERTTLGLQLINLGVDAMAINRPPHCHGDTDGKTDKRGHDHEVRLQCTLQSVLGARMATAPEFIYIATKSAKSAIKRVRAATFKPKINRRPGSIDDPALATKLTAAFAKAVAAAKEENDKLE